MGCIRCKMVVNDELTKLRLHYTTVELGEADILENISALQQQQFKAALLKWGLELIDDKKSVLIQKIKNVIIEESLIDVAAQKRWKDYSEARDEMLLRTNLKHAPWFIVNADNKKATHSYCCLDLFL